MKEKICLIMVLILTMIMSVSLAEEEITVSARVNAELYADQALEQNYGITLLLQEYYIRTVEEKDNNVFIVRYEGLENYAYVLGRYEIAVDRNQVVEITWSHDGENISGGFDAEAWGAEQIMEMLRLNQETGDTSLFDTRVAKINEKHLITMIEGVPQDCIVFDAPDGTVHAYIIDEYGSGLDGYRLTEGQWEMIIGGGDVLNYRDDARFVRHQANQLRPDGTAYGDAQGLLISFRSC